MNVGFCQARRAADVSFVRRKIGTLRGGRQAVLPRGWHFDVAAKRLHGETFHELLADGNDELM